MRALLVGGGQRGLALTRELVAEGHAVRFVTRTEEHRATIEDAGAECWIGDPDRIGSLRYAVDNVTVLLWFLGTARGSNVGALHGSRLTMMLERTIDSVVRGVVYEASGPVGGELLDAGAAEVRRMAIKNEIPYEVLKADPQDVGAWVPAAQRAIERVLTARRGVPA